MNEGEWHAKSIGDSCGSLCTSCIRGDHYGLLVVGNLELNVFAEEMATVEIVNGDVKETLVLRIWSSLV